jgi:adenosylcobinamide-GDP ribazoletransferase
MLLAAWRLSPGTLTAVPVAPPVLVDRRRAGLGMLLAPLAALPLAAAVTAVALLARLSDTVDGLAASYDRERSLAVMKGGMSGPAGVLAVMLAGCAVCVSRAALAVCCGRGVPSARPGGLGDTYTRRVAWPVVALVWLGGALALPLASAWAGLDWWRGLLAAAVGSAVVAVVVARAVRRFGGVTGDVFGVAVELAPAALLVGLS